MDCCMEISMGLSQIKKLTLKPIYIYKSRASTHLKSERTILLSDGYYTTTKKKKKNPRTREGSEPICFPRGL